MSKNKLGEKKYVLMTIITGVFLVIGSLVVDFNYLDAAYLAFLAISFIRYIIIKKEENCD